MGSVPAVDGFILAADLRAMGVDSRAHRRARERGELERPHRGVYVPAEQWASLKPSGRYRLQVLGAARASRSAPTLCHVSAAALWGVPLIGGSPRLVHVMSTPSVGTRSEGGFRRHATARPDLEVSELEGVLLTSLARTIAEFASDMPFADSVIAIDWAIAPSSRQRPKPVTSKAQIIAVASQLNLVRGRRRLERAIDFADERSGSPGESLSRAAMHEIGIPRPELQVDFFDRRGFIGTVDFWWPQHNLIGEFDGVAKYVREEYTARKSPAQVVIDEKNRENRLRATGPGMTRWDWSVANSPTQLLQHLTAAGLPSSRRQQRT